MVITGLMKRLIAQIPINQAGHKANSRSKDFGVQVANYMICLKKRLSIRPQFKASLAVDSSAIDDKCGHLVDLFIEHVMEYDAHCEHEENEVERRKEKEHQDAHDKLQNDLNAKT